MSLTDEDIQNLKDWGTNIVRFGVFWEALETAPGIYNQDYLNQIESIVARLGKHKIYTILDSHVDLFSRQFCGEGVPSFYTPAWDTLDHSCPMSLTGIMFSTFGQCKPFSSFHLPRGDDGFPDMDECFKRKFIDLYSAPEVASAYEAFW